MVILRIVAAALGALLIVGEGTRRWGTDVYPAFWLDDMILGAMLLLAAWLVKIDDLKTRALFTGVWGMAAGGLYGSFWGKAAQSGYSETGYAGADYIVVTLGVLWGLSIVGFLGSIFVRR